MPTYMHECQEEDCKHCFEEFYWMYEEPPTKCPKCGRDTLKRVIGYGSAGVVELTGHELVQKLREDGKKMAKEASKSENLYANLLGESKYQSLTNSFDKARRG